MYHIIVERIYGSTGSTNIICMTMPCSGFWRKMEETRKEKRRRKRRTQDGKKSSKYITIVVNSCITQNYGQIPSIFVEFRETYLKKFFQCYIKVFFLIVFSLRYGKSPNIMNLGENENSQRFVRGAGCICTFYVFVEWSGRLECAMMRVNKKVQKWN